MRPGFAVDDGVALHFRNTHLERVVSSRADGSAYHVERVDDEIHERTLAVSYLGAPASISEPVGRAVAAA